MSAELLIMVGGLALLDTLSPATIGVTVYLLLTDKVRLASRLVVYLVTIAGLYFATGVFLMLGLGYLLDFASGAFQNRIVSWTVFIIGAILFITSFFVPQNKKSNLSAPRSKSLVAMFLMGFTTFLIEGTTALPYFVAIGLLTTSDANWMEWVTVLLAYNFIMVLPPLILYVLYLLVRSWMQKPLEKLRVKIANSTGFAFSWVMCIVGLLLIFNSLDYL